MLCPFNLDLNNNKHWISLAYHRGLSNYYTEVVTIIYKI